ncbi:hypothetical protein BDR03DRAFT_1091372 [Suillus americanus]|nr:hypothetical protein BDR03DRAFT_1091372 [Suillus americanus]
MQMKFIPSVLLALKALLKGPTWLLQKVISIFFGRREYPLPPPPPSSALCSPSDSPYQSAHLLHQRSYEYTRSQQQQSTPPVFPDVAPVTEPAQSHTPQRSRRFSGPELATRAPEVDVTPVVIDPNEDTDSLRLKARNEGNLMEECFNQSREAYARNERRLAKQLSLRGEAYKVNMELLDKEASTKIFQENNKGLGPNTINLHRLFVFEAKEYFDDAIQGVRDRGQSSLYVIVGKGNHSENNIPRIKPEIQEHGKSLGLSVEVDTNNDGCLIVNLNDPS